MEVAGSDTDDPLQACANGVILILDKVEIFLKIGKKTETKDLFLYSCTMLVLSLVLLQVSESE